MNILRAKPLVIPASALILLCGVWLGACSDDNPSSLAPFEPEVANVADSFSLQATGVTGVTATVRYTWANSGTRATLNHSTTTDAGSAQLVIKDSAGATVYDKALEESLNEPSEVGAPGDWLIEVKLTNYSGTLNIVAEKL